MAWAFFRTVSKGALWVGAGLLVAGTGGAAAPILAPIGGVLVGAGGYSVAKGTIRGVRELVDEEDGDMFFVYYDLENVAAVVANYYMPENSYTDIIASASNKKLAHCKAWFTTSKYTYVTFEITSGKSYGEIARKRVPSSLKTDSSMGIDYLQLIMKEESGSLGEDN